MLLYMFLLLILLLLFVVVAVVAVVFLLLLLLLLLWSYGIFVKPNQPPPCPSSSSVPTLYWNLWILNFSISEYEIVFSLKFKIFVLEIMIKLVNNNMILKQSNNRCVQFVPNMNEYEWNEWMFQHMRRSQTTWRCRITTTTTTRGGPRHASPRLVLHHSLPCPWVGFVYRIQKSWIVCKNNKHTHTHSAICR